MKNVFLCVSLICFTVTFSCCTQPAKQGVELAQINIDPDQVENFIDISPMLDDSIEIIPLETTDECLLSNIERLIFYKGHFYILDEPRRNIFVFDEAGRFVRKIGKQGSGPGEYSSILFFDIIGDSIFVSSKLGFKCFVYNLTTGELIKDFFHEVSHVDGFSLDKSVYFITNYEKVDKGNFNLCRLDLSNEKVVDKFMPFDNKQSKFKNFGLADYVCLYKDSAYVILPYNDTIYQVTKEEVTPMYKVHFTTRNLPEDMQPIDVKSRRVVAEEAYVKGLEDIQISKDYILGMYFDKYSIRNVLINRHTLEAKVTNCFSVKKLGYLPLSKFFVLNEDLISIESMSSLETSLNTILSSSQSCVEERYKERLKELQKNLKEDSNPVLFRYRFKETH